MKKIIILQTLLILTSCSSPVKQKPKSFDRHVGAWSFEKDGRKGSLILRENQEFKFVVDGKTYGGEHFKNSEGKTMECRYVLNPNRNPIPIYMYSYEAGNPEKTKKGLRGIIRFLSDNKMEARLSFDPSKPRFNSFDPKDTANTLLLVRE
jgi:hypothetical protein